jgi:M6 family metalloprotease-like protein
MKNRCLFRLAIILFTLVIAASPVTGVLAAPAAPIDQTLTQPDGTTFTARQWGDEWQNGFETISGYTILQESDGWWVYATVAQDGALSAAMQEEAGRLVVGIDSPDGLPLHIRPSQETVTEGTTDELYSSNIGTQPVLVLLASFSDRNGTYSAANFASSIFGASNSVKDFYLDASFNQLTLAPATETHGTVNDGVIGWLNLGYNHPNTTTNTDSRNQLIVKNALIAANPYINYATYDTNGDGYISNTELHIVVVVAGYETSYNGNTPAIWAHRWNLNNITPPVLDGKVLGQYPYGGYAQFGEIHGSHMATIGVMVHELGHDLTWPDLYDVDDSSEGVGEWSIMSSGSWNYSTGYPGSAPALPSAWEKWYQGWITPTPVYGTLSNVSIGQAETNAKAYLLRENPNGVDWNFYYTSGTGEYFLVENRQLTGYDAGLPGCGLLIWHIDESVTEDNYANANESRPLVKLIEADGLNELYYGYDRGDAGDPFPGTAHKTTFNYSSTPNSRLYSGADSLVSVTGIGSCAASMTANLTYGVFTLTVNSAHGTVTKNPNNATYTYGSSVLLTMSSVDTGFIFTGWSGGGCSGTAPCTVTIYDNTTVTANFIPDPAVFTEQLYLPVTIK